MFIFSFFLKACEAFGRIGGTREGGIAEYDTGISTVLIKSNLEMAKNAALHNLFDDEQSLEGIVTQDLIKKKEDWEKRNPDKRIVTMTIVTGTINDPSVNESGKSFIYGLLIHYEKKSKKGE